MNQRWLPVNWILSMKYHHKRNQNSDIFNQENTFEDNIILLFSAGATELKLAFFLKGKAALFGNTRYDHIRESLSKLKQVCLIFLRVPRFINAMLTCRHSSWNGLLVTLAFVVYYTHGGYPLLLARRTFLFQRFPRRRPFTVLALVATTLTSGRFDVQRHPLLLVGCKGET